MLNEIPDSFIMISGAKGLGKMEMIKEATASKKYKLVINADELVKARNFKEQLESLAKQVGYRPILSFISSLTNAMELMITATTGQKADITTTPRSQVEKILECTTVALKNIKEKQQKALQDQKKKQHRTTGSTEDQAVITIPPDNIPVIVLNRFMNRTTPFASVIAEWAAGLVENGLAHVIISTRNVSALRELQRGKYTT